MARVLLWALPMLDALDSRHRSQLRACLLGTAIGESVGTEQSALLLTSLIESACVVERARTSFRRNLLAWSLRVPFEVSFATLRSCMRILLHRSDTGVASANHEAALRSPILGAALPFDAARRRALTRALARVTHRDPRAIEAAVFVAELSAACANPADRDRATLVLTAARAAQHAEVREVIEGAVQLGLFKDGAWDLRHDGSDALDTIRLCVWAFVRHGDAPISGIRAALSVGGTTAPAASIVGGWLGVLHGEHALPHALLDAMSDGPFGPTQLCALVASAAGVRAPHYSRAWALARNLRSLLGWSRARLLPR